MLNFVTNTNKKNLIIFIHGFKGGIKTWIRKDKRLSLLNYLESERDISDHYDFAVFDYFTKVTEIFSKIAFLLKFVGIDITSRKNLTIKSIGDLLKSEIDYNCKQYEKIVLIAHSMGGLVAKSYILDELNSGRKLKAGMYISLAVPHSGSDYATFGSIIVNHPQINALRSLSEQIHSMHQGWVKQKDHLPITLYFQAKNDQIVPETSSIAIDGRDLEIVYSDDDHFSIVAPKNEKSVVISAIKESCIFYNKTSVRITSSSSTKSISDSYGQAVVRKAVVEHQQSNAAAFGEKLKVSLDRDLLNIEIFYRQIKGNDTTYTLEGFINEIKSSELVMLAGVGGLGKSLLLKRIMLKIADTNKHAFIIFCEAKYWRDTYSNGLKKELPLEQRVNNLLSGFQVTLTTAELINDFGALKENESLEKYFFLDGLNEIPNSRIRNEIIDLLFDFHKNFGFIIGVLTRYQNPEEHKNWKNFELERLDKATLKSIVAHHFNKRLEDYTERNLEYLALPYFLDIAIKNNRDIVNGYSDYLYDHVLKNLKMPKRDGAIKDLANLAYKAYQSNNKFIIPDKDITPSIRKNYVDTKILFKSDQGYLFEHHLINELFVANKISQDQNLWSRQTFDLITFENRISFEVVQMILEQINKSEDGDKYLTSLYDWNFYAVLHCLRNVDRNYSNQLAVLIILILTEKLYDKFSHTKKKVKAYLKPLFEKFQINAIPEKLDDYIDRNPTIEENYIDFIRIIESNLSYFTSGEYIETYKLLSNKDEAINEQLIIKLVDSDPLTGWSCSNVLKRHKFNPEIEAQLRILFLSNNNFIYKWRIVHALGNSSTMASANFLLDIIKTNEYMWVTYGAIRSLFEIALFNSTKDECEELLEKLSSILDSQIFTKSCVYEIKSCLESEIEVDKKPAALKLIERAISSLSENFLEKEIWKNLKNKFT